MKIAVVGSKNLRVTEIDKYLPKNVSEIVSGGARGIDACAKEYALKNNLKLKEFLPEYNKYRKYAPLKRNIQIIEYADEILAFWDGKSKGTKFVIEECKAQNKKVTVVKVATKEKS